MSGAQGRAVSRVESADGTVITYFSHGRGDPAVFVHGLTADHTSWRMLQPYLGAHMTVHAMDRRGRRRSGDCAAYDVRREFEDVAAVVDAVAGSSGSEVGLFGHSFGGIFALGGASLTANVGRMVLYEPSMNDLQVLPDGFVNELDDLLEAGDHEAVLEAFYREGLGLTDSDIAELRSLPSWRPRAAAARTVPRELRGVDQGGFDPQRAAVVSVPTLLLLGEDSPRWMKTDVHTIADALPDARVRVLEGQEHLAHYTAPEQLARHILSFLDLHE